MSLLSLEMECDFKKKSWADLRHGWILDISFLILKQQQQNKNKNKPSLFDS